MFSSKGRSPLTFIGLLNGIGSFGKSVIQSPLASLALFDLRCRVDLNDSTVMSSPCRSTETTDRSRVFLISFLDSN